MGFWEKARHKTTDLRASNKRYKWQEKRYEERRGIGPVDLWALLLDFLAVNDYEPADLGEARAEVMRWLVGPIDEDEGVVLPLNRISSGQRVARKITWNHRKGYRIH